MKCQLNHWEINFLFYEISKKRQATGKLRTRATVTCPVSFSKQYQRVLALLFPKAEIEIELVNTATGFLVTLARYSNLLKWLVLDFSEHQLLVIFEFLLLHVSVEYQVRQLCEHIDS